LTSALQSQGDERQGEIGTRAGHSVFWGLVARIHGLSLAAGEPRVQETPGRADSCVAIRACPPDQCVKRRGVLAVELAEGGPADHRRVGVHGPGADIEEELARLYALALGQLVGSSEERAALGPERALLGRSVRRRGLLDRSSGE
jgi:hypothetical protein